MNTFELEYRILYKRSSLYLNLYSNQWKTSRTHSKNATSSWPTSQPLSMNAQSEENSSPKTLTLIPTAESPNTRPIPNSPKAHFSSHFRVSMSESNRKSSMNSTCKSNSCKEATLIWTIWAIMSKTSLVTRLKAWLAL